MAGRGSRLRPQTLITPKPLVPIAGIPILNQLVSDTIKLVDEPIDEMIFIIGDPIFLIKMLKKILIYLLKSIILKLLFLDN